MPSETDANAVELGVKFRTTTDGFITGIRFYKGPANTGVHTARLWSATGTLLQTATFTGETATGWQQAVFGAPVAVSANTVYVASYHAPNGGYAATPAAFATAGVITPPLEALSSAASGGNGVYRYGPPAFPNQTFNAANYWVDAVFATSVTPDTTAPQVLNTLPLAAAASTSGPVVATFNESMSPASINAAAFQLRTGAGALVAANVSYNAVTRSAVLQPQAPLAHETAYTAVVRGGPTGVRDLAGNALAVDHGWTFTTIGTPAPAAGTGPGGPVLVITSSSRPFSSYYTEILRAEGLNAFTVADLSAVTPALLSQHDVAILGEVPLSPADVATFTAWVTGGGNLIAMRPDKQLAGLLGLTDANATLNDAYLQVQTAAAPGAGIVADTMQFHGTADRYVPNGAAVVATLYRHGHGRDWQPGCDGAQRRHRGRTGRRVHLRPGALDRLTRDRAIRRGPVRSATASAHPLRRPVLRAGPSRTGWTSTRWPFRRPTNSSACSRT